MARTRTTSSASHWSQLVDLLAFEITHAWVVSLHRSYRRKNQKNYAAESLREQEKCHRDIQKVQSDTRREIEALHETRDVVLGSGKKALQAYCTLLITKKHAAEEEEAQAAATSSASSPARAKSSS